MALWDNLTNHWKLEESTGSRVDSVGSINLNASTLAVSGKSGGGEMADSTSHSLTGVGILMLGGTDISVALWIRHNGSGNRKTLFSASSATITVSLSTTNKLTLSCDGRTLIHSTTVTEGDWHLVVATVDQDTELGLSLDGAVPETFAGAYTTSNATLQACFVNHSDDDLSVDEISLFDRVLNAADASVLWNGGAGRFYPSGTTPAPAVATWVVSALQFAGPITPAPAVATWVVPTANPQGLHTPAPAVATWTVPTASPIGPITPAPVVSTWTVSAPAFTGPLPQPAAAATWTIPRLSQVGLIPEVVAFGSVTVKTARASSITVRQ